MSPGSRTSADFLGAVIQPCRPRVYTCYLPNWQGGRLLPTAPLDAHGIFQLLLRLDPQWAWPYDMKLKTPQWIEGKHGMVETDSVTFRTHHRHGSGNSYHPTLKTFPLCHRNANLWLTVASKSFSFTLKYQHVPGPRLSSRRTLTQT